MATLRASFDGDVLIVGDRPTEPRDPLHVACEHGRFDTRLQVDYDSAGNIAFVVADGIASAWRSVRLDGEDPSTNEAPVVLWSEASEAGFWFTDDPGMYWREPGETLPDDTPRWNGVAIDLTGGPPAPHGGDYDDFYPFSHCPDCADDDDKPYLGVCIRLDGRVNGFFIEAPAAVLPRPTNAGLRVRGSGHWPD